MMWCCVFGQPLLPQECIAIKSRREKKSADTYRICDEFIWHGISTVMMLQAGLSLFKAYRTCSPPPLRTGSAHHFFFENYHDDGNNNAQSVIHFLATGSFSLVRDHFPEYFLSSSHIHFFLHHRRKLCTHTIIMFLLRDTRAHVYWWVRAPGLCCREDPHFCLPIKKLRFVNGTLWM